jgi:addiction module RelE/StbE family toxin
MGHDLKLKWSKRALADISRIIEYIAQDKPIAGQQFAVTIRAKADYLRQFPYMGREVLPGVRELVVHQHYLLSYRIKSGCVEILQIWHVAQRRY